MRNIILGNGTFKRRRCRCVHILWMDMVKKMEKYFSHFICGFSDFRILKISKFLKPVLLFFQIFEFLNFLKIWSLFCGGIYHFILKKIFFPEIPPPLSIKVCCEVDQEKRIAGALLTPDIVIDKKDCQRCVIHNKIFFISLLLI